MSNRLYASQIIENNLKALSKFKDTLNEKSDIRKSKNRVLNDLKLINTMCQELLQIANFNSADTQRILTLSRYIEKNENQVRHAENVNTIKDVLERMNDRKDENWEFTLSDARAYIMDLVAESRSAVDCIDQIDARKIMSHINANRDFSIFSPRAFDGETLLRLSASASKKAITYGLESNDYYHAQAKQVVDRMIKGKMQGSTISNKVFDMLQITLPVSWVVKIGITGNLLEKEEKTTLRNVVKYLRDDGIFLCAIPKTRITRDMAMLFSKILKDVQILEKEDCSSYAYIIGKKAIQSEPREDVYKLLINAEVNTKKELNFKYDLASGGLLQPDFFRGSVLDEDDLINLIRNSGLRSSFWKAQEIKEKDDSVRPLLPFNMGQIGLVLTSGCLDGTVEEYPGQYHAIKGMVTKIRNVENSRENQNETSVETISNKVQINLITPNGEFIELA